jgi:hypothetical protein
MVIFSLALISPLLLFFLSLWLGNALGDYFLTNWILNLKFAPGDTFFIYKYFKRFILKDIIFWLVATSSVLYLLVNKKTDFIQKIIAGLGLAIFSTLFIYKRPHGHYFMFGIAVLSISVGVFLSRMMKKFKLNEIQKIVIIFFLLVSPVWFLLRESVNRNERQLSRADFVLKNTKSSDLIYDGDNRFNLFRPDLHYFWYSLKNTRGLDTYNRITGNRYINYDICDLIKEKKPKFISDFKLNLQDCGLYEIYRKTVHKNLYIKIKNE